MTHRVRLRSDAQALLAAATAATLLLLAGCQPIQPMPEEDAAAPPAAPQPTVVVDGLNGPMGVLVDREGTGDIWVVDSGLGGEEPAMAMNPETGEIVPVTVGLSAQVVRISAADGSTEQVALLTSYGSPEFGASGGNRLALLDGVLYASVSEWLSTPDRPAPEGVATIVTIGEDGAVTEIHDDWAWESTVNPYPPVMHAHPFGLLPGPDGLLWVANAGANALLTLDPASGEYTVIAVFEPLPGVFPRPEYDNQMLTDPVPTSVAMKDGEIYVSLLSGVPFVPGSAKVLHVAQDGSFSDYATSLTMLTDMRLGPDNELYATTFGGFGEQGFVPGGGMVVRVHEGDASEVLLTGLDFVTSLDFDVDGNLYVTVNGVGAPGSGQLLRFDGVTEMTGPTVTEVLGAQ